MSTRAIYTFKDEYSEVSVYKHHDGYPTGGIEALLKAIPFAWPFPRFEADEFAASFVCANKLPYWIQDKIVNFLNDLSVENKLNNDVNRSIDVTIPYYHIGKDSMRGGGVRLIPQNVEPHNFASDAEYRYFVTQDKKGTVWVSVYHVNYWENKKEETFCFKRPLLKATKAAKEWENKRVKENA